MLSLEQVIDYLKIWAEEIDALAKHDYAHGTIAAERHKYVIESPDGKQMLEQTILDDMSDAFADGDFQLAGKLLAVMRDFIENHPDNPRASHRIDDASD